jgi:hypothetical protein
MFWKHADDCRWVYCVEKMKEREDMNLLDVDTQLKEMPSSVRPVIIKVMKEREDE